MSAADPAARCRSFADCNLESQKAMHWFRDIAGQTHGAACLRHPYSSGCNPCPVLADVGILGSPCHPFSRQRSGHWTEGSVEAHAEFDVSMQQCMEWLERFIPAVLVFEQVMGFTMPFHKNTKETPLARLHGCHKNC